MKISKHKTKLCKLICAMLILISLAAMASCGKTGGESGTAFYVDIINQADCDIYAVCYEYYLDGRACGGGACENADGTALRTGDMISKEFIPADIPEGMSLEGFHMSVAVRLEDGTEVECKGGIAISPEYGRHYEYVLSGSVSAGFYMSCKETE